MRKTVLIYLLLLCGVAFMFTHTKRETEQQMLQEALLKGDLECSQLGYLYTKSGTPLKLHGHTIGCTAGVK